MHLPKLKKKHTVPALLISLFFGGILFLKLKGVSPDGKSNRLWDSAPSKVAGLAAPLPQIVFAGLSGSPPRYIDQGAFRGTGWEEYETQEIRRGLRADGFDIKLEWMTPARIEHEFASGSPICFWPVEWKNPVQLFSKQTNRIYSIPLKIRGDEHRSILFKRENSPKFAKHIDQKGNLNLDSLLRDPKLKTLLVRNQDYGSVNQLVTQLDSQGEQFVKNDYKKSVELRVIRDNRQLLEMLNADRFDYIFSDSIEDQDFSVSKIDKAKFSDIVFNTQSVFGSQDPKLIRISIACSTHPLSIQAMPYINKWIQSVRSETWIRVKADYRKLVDPKVVNIYSTTEKNFIASLKQGKMDQWYSLQQRQFPSLKLFPEPKALTFSNALPPPELSHPVLWGSFRVAPKTLVLINEIDAALVLQDDKTLQSHPQLKTFLEKKDRFKASMTNTAFTSLTWDPKLEVEDLTLFAAGLTPEDLILLQPILSSPSLKKLTLRSAGRDSAQFIVKLLPKSLTSLDLNDSSLLSAPIADAVKSMPLRALSLDSTGLSSVQLENLLANLNPEIEELSLRDAYFWNEKATLAFNRNSWLRLKALDLGVSPCNFSCWYSKKDMIPFLPSSLEFLSLKSANLRPEDVRRLFSRPFPRLKNLNLDRNRIFNPKEGSLSLPQSITEFTCERCSLNDELASLLRLPPRLASINLSENPIADRGLAPFIKNLSEHVAEVNFSDTRLTVASLSALASNERIQTIASLNLSKTDVSDHDLLAFQKARFQVSNFKVSTSKVMNESISLFNQPWLSHLTSLDLSRTLVSESGIRALALGMPEKLEGLRLDNIAGLDLDTLAPALPKHLKTLSLSNNQISDREMAILVPHLPKTLEELRLSGSGFGSDGAYLLAKHLPDRLMALTLDQLPLLTGPGLISIANRLSPRLHLLELGPVQMTLESSSAFEKHLPKYLKSLTLTSTKELEDGFSGVFKVLPNSLISLKLVSVPLSDEAAVQLNRSWPKNLRFLFLESLRGSDSAMTKLFQDWPASVNKFDLTNSSLNRRAFEGIFSGEDFNQVFMASFNGMRLPSDPLRILASKRLALGGLVLIGANLRQESLNELSSDFLAQLGLLLLGHNPIGSQAVLKFVKKLPPHFKVLGLLSTGLTSQSIPQLLKVLPPDLQLLVLTGNDIGQSGLEKVRLYKAKKEAEKGIYALDVHE